MRGKPKNELCIIIYTSINLDFIYLSTYLNLSWILYKISASSKLRLLFFTSFIISFENLVHLILSEYPIAATVYLLCISCDLESLGNELSMLVNIPYNWILMYYEYSSECWDNFGRRHFNHFMHFLTTFYIEFNTCILICLIAQKQGIAIMRLACSIAMPSWMLKMESFWTNVPSSKQQPWALPRIWKISTWIALFA